MKKFPVFLALCLMFGTWSLTACGAPSDSDQSDSDDPTVQTPQEPETIDGRTVIPESKMNTYTEDVMRLLGRTYKLSRQLHLSNAGTGFELSFYGTKLTANIYLSQGSGHYYRCFIDGDEEGSRVYIGKSAPGSTIAENLDEGVHTVKIIKATSSQNGDLIFNNLQTDGKFLAPEKKSRIRIEFVGDSITVGAGVFATPSESTVYENSDATKSYAYLTAKELNADFSLVATEGMCVKQKISFVPNMLEMYAAMSSTQSLPYTFPHEQDIVVVALGTNDAYCLKNGYGQSEFGTDYAELLTLIRSKNPSARIVCVYGMMNDVQAIKGGIGEAIESMDDDKITYLQLPTKNNGGGGHPSESDAVAQSTVLTNYLKTLIS